VIANYSMPSGFESQDHRWRIENFYEKMLKKLLTVEWRCNILFMGIRSILIKGDSYAATPKMPDGQSNSQRDLF
jgi:hypothetical protein